MRGQKKRVHLERAFEWKPDTRQQTIPLLPFGSDGVFGVDAVRLPSDRERLSYSVLPRFVNHPFAIINMVSLVEAGDFLPRGDVEKKVETGIVSGV